MFRFRAVGDGHNGFRKAAKKPVHARRGLPAQKHGSSRCWTLTARTRARRASCERLAAAGTPIGAYDVLIAGQALVRALTLVTHNTGEFQRVPGLRLEDWE
jgi:hypothetical protein